jgi:hypothetical protein
MLKRLEWTVVALLLLKLQAKDEDVGLLQMKAALRDAIKRRFALQKQNII